MARNLIRIGSEVQINLDPNVDNEQSNPDVAVMSDGRFFVVYEDENRPDPPPDVDIIGQFVSAAGTLSTHSFNGDAPEFDGGIQINPAVAPRANGAAIVVWQDRSVSGAEPNIQLAIINSAGKNVTLGPAGANELDVVAGTSADATANSNPDVATFANGQSIIVWERHVTDDDINARVLKADGTGFTTTQRIPIDISGTSASPTYSQRPAVATSGNKALIAYEDERGSGNSDIRGVLYDATTGIVGPSVVIADRGADLFRASVAALSDGRYVVSYDEDDGTGNSNVFARIVDASGHPVGKEIVVANTSADENFSTVAALPDGGFIMAWDNDEPLQVHARRFLADGTPGGDEFVAAPLAQRGIFPSVAVSPSGRVYVAFEDIDARPGDSDPQGIRGSAFQVVTEVINGTILDDRITTYNLGETINGGDGNDIINAMGGNDTVSGADGNDNIAAGAGNDAVSAGDGNDLVSGEAGDDFIGGGLGNDTLVGGTGRDRLRFDTALDKRTNVDHLSGFVPADDTIDLDNSIFTKLKQEGVALKAKFFEAGRNAGDHNDYIVYNDKTGKLFYDKDGDGSHKKVLFAILDLVGTDHPPLAASDFFVI